MTNKIDAQHLPAMLINNIYEYYGCVGVCECVSVCECLILTYKIDTRLLWKLKQQQQTIK